MSVRVTKALREAKKQIEQANYPNVTGVGIGYKRIDGKSTKELVVVVFVNRKLGKKDLSIDSVIPKEVVTTDGNIQTDVVQSGEFAVARLDGLLTELCERKRPIAPGYSVGHPDVSAGTIGLIVKKPQTASFAY